MARLIALVTTALVLLTAACGDGNGDARSTDTSSPPETTTSVASSTTTGAGEACSAAGAPAAQAQPGLPEPVSALRRDIVGAARACDYQRLEELALAGAGSFTYSFGAEGDPAGYWRMQERSDTQGKPLRFLVGLLATPHRSIEVGRGGETQYVWPAAFAYDSWASVPEPDKQALRPLYTEEDFDGFERFGAYIGYRVGITADGDWLFFVAGD